MVLTAEGNESGIKIFSTVERGAGNTKIYLVTTKTSIQEATKWADEFTNKMETISSSAEFWQEQTGFISPPERVNRAEATDAHIAYSNFLRQTFEKSVGKDTRSALSSAPDKRSYSRVVYGKTEGSVNTTTTNDTVTSTITSNDLPPQRNIDDIKISILDTMNKLNKLSEARVDRIEDATKKYDDVLQAMVLNNQQKDRELNIFEDRLNKIGEVSNSMAARVDETAHKVDMTSVKVNETAHKVDMTSVKVDITSSKVDKLGMVFKQFIQAMASGRTTNPANMHAIANLLDEEENASMDIDEVAVTPSTSPLITQPSPGKNIDSALGGEGSKK